MLQNRNAKESRNSFTARLFLIESDHESTIRLSKTCQLVSSGSVVWTSLNEYDDTAFQRRHRFSAAGKFVDNETDYYVLARLTIIINRFTFSATRLTRRLELSRAAWPRFLFAPFDPQSRPTFLIKRDPPINSRVTEMDARRSHWSRISSIFFYLQWPLSILPVSLPIYLYFSQHDVPVELSNLVTNDL